MELARMAKITVVADGSRWLDVVNNMREVGVRYFHMLECAALESENRSPKEVVGQKKVLVEALTEPDKASILAQVISAGSEAAKGSSVAVSEVAVSTGYTAPGEGQRAPTYKQWWERDIVSI